MNLFETLLHPDREEDEERAKKLEGVVEQDFRGRGPAQARAAGACRGRASAARARPAPPGGIYGGQRGAGG